MAKFSILYTHPDRTASPTITLKMPSGDRALVRSSAAYDLLADGYSSAEILQELLHGCLYANLLAGFIALVDPLTDVEDLNPDSEQWARLISTGLLGPFKQSNRKAPYVEYLESSDTFVSYDAIPADIDVIGILGSPSRMVIVNGAGNLYCCGSGANAADGYVYGVQAGATLPLKLKTIYAGGSTVTNVILLK